MKAKFILKHKEKTPSKNPASTIQETIVETSIKTSFKVRAIKKIYPSHIEQKPYFAASSIKNPHVIPGPKISTKDHVQLYISPGEFEWILLSSTESILEKNAGFLSPSFAFGWAKIFHSRRDKIRKEIEALQEAIVKLQKLDSQLYAEERLGILNAKVTILPPQKGPSSNPNPNSKRKRALTIGDLENLLKSDNCPGEMKGKIRAILQML